MKGISLGIKSLFRRSGGLIFGLLVAITAIMLIFCQLLKETCNIYRSVNENPCSDHYRMLIDRRILGDIMSGYESKDRMFAGEYSSVSVVRDYFKNITDYTYELCTTATSSDIQAYIPLSSKYNDSFYISGISQSVEISEFSRGELTLKEGRLLTRSDRDSQSFVCLISDELARINGLDIGDEISFELSEDESNYTIVGIYHDNVFRDETLISTSSESMLNRVYVPVSTIENENYYPTCYNFQIKLDDDRHIEKIEELTNEYKLTGYPTKFIKVEDIYKADSSGIRTLESSITLLADVLSVVAVLEAFLYVWLLVDRRKQELGVLLALGRNGFDLLLSVMTELTLPAVTALTASSVLAKLFGMDIAGKIMEFAARSVSVESISNTTSERILFSEYTQSMQTAAISLQSVKSAVIFATSITAIMLFAAAIGSYIRLMSIKRIDLVRKEG